jgi:hypothetical protein
MKIAPYTKGWNEGERDWSFVEDPLSKIEAWEKAEGVSLPPRYRDFLLEFNGGRVYPRLFKHSIGSLQAGPYVDSSSETFVDLIFNWSTVESHWKRETYGDGVPPGYLVIAETPGAIQLLMAVNPESHGKIVTWLQSRNTWGTQGNDKTFNQADSFEDFLASLYDDAQSSDYDRWRLPIYDKLSRELAI